MSGNALKRLGIGDLTQEPTAGVLVKLTPETFMQVKKILQPILGEVGDQGVWTTGGAGSWDPDHPFAAKGTVKIDSGDVDVFMDTTAIKTHMKLDPAMKDADVRKVVAGEMAKYYPTTQIGTNVHMGVPAGYKIAVPALGKELPAYYQIDLMTMANAHAIAKHHEHDYSVKGTPYKGVDQQLALASLINTIPGEPERTFQYHGFGGALKNRATGEVITHDIDKIAKLVLGPQANASDLGNVESILAKLPQGIDNPRMAQFKADMEKKQAKAIAESVKSGSAEWFRALTSKLGV
jgi:hypothetical protein